MLKNLLLGAAVIVGTTGTSAGVTCLALYFTVWKDNGTSTNPGLGDGTNTNPGLGENKPGTNEPNKPSNPNEPTTPDLEALKRAKEAFVQALNSSTFVKPLAFKLNVKVEDNQDPEKAILNELATKWSVGTSTGINIKKSDEGTEWVVVLSSKTNAYTKNIFGKTWNDIMDENQNTDFQNIQQVVYGFRLIPNENDNTKYRLYPIYTQVSFIKKEQQIIDKTPEWLKILDNSDSYRASLLNPDPSKPNPLVSTITTTTTITKTK